MKNLLEKSLYYGVLTLFWVALTASFVAILLYISDIGTVLNYFLNKV